MTMANIFDFNAAGEQRSLELIPMNTVVSLQMTVRPGNVGNDGWLTKSADGASEGLDVEFVVVDGQFVKKKLWQRFTLHGTTPGHAEAGEISRNTLRAILESARGIIPGDKSDAAQAARRVSGWGDFQDIRFIARVGVRPPKDGYPAKNTIMEVVTPDRPAWRKLEQLIKPSNGGAAPTPAAVTTTTPPTNAVVRPQWAG
jgi:hypothetical protein